MKKHLTKLFAPLLVVLLVASFFGAPTSPVAGQTQTAQDKAATILENVLSVDLSKYTPDIKIGSMEGVPLSSADRKLTNLAYTLTPLENNDENNIIKIYFTAEKDIIINYFVSLASPQVITTTQYANQYEAAKNFLEKYQTYTHINSDNLITLLSKVDLTKNSTITQENTKLTVSVNSLLGEQVTLRWTYTVSDVDYTVLEISIDAGGFVRAMFDNRALYTIGDTTIKITKEQAIDIALENLQFYSYDMPDGSVVKDFKVSRDNVVAVLASSPVDYELRPYWDIRMVLDEVYPGSVHGITAFIWANTGEVISYGNIAFGGTVTPDNPNPANSEPLLSGYTLLVVLAAVIAAVVIASVSFGLLVKKRHKQT